MLKVKVNSSSREGEVSCEDIGGGISQKMSSSSRLVRNTSRENLDSLGQNCWDRPETLDKRTEGIKVRGLYRRVIRNLIDRARIL